MYSHFGVLKYIFFFSCLQCLGTIITSSWVIDSGATDHDPLSTKICKYKPFPSHKKITMADVSTTIVAGQGDIVINKILALKNVLHVPKLFTNLLSIQKLTKDSNCNVVFNGSHCIFQELGTRRMIGHAREKNSLYYLEESSGQDRVMNSSPF